MSFLPCPWTKFTIVDPHAHVRTPPAGTSRQLSKPIPRLANQSQGIDGRIVNAVSTSEENEETTIRFAATLAHAARVPVAQPDNLQFEYRETPDDAQIGAAEHLPAQATAEFRSSFRKSPSKHRTAASWQSQACRPRTCARSNSKPVAALRQKAQIDAKNFRNLALTARAPRAPQKRESPHLQSVSFSRRASASRRMKRQEISPKSNSRMVSLCPGRFFACFTVLLGIFSPAVRGMLCASPTGGIIEIAPACPCSFMAEPLPSSMSLKGFGLTRMWRYGPPRVAAVNFMTCAAAVAITSKLDSRKVASRFCHTAIITHSALSAVCGVSSKCGPHTAVPTHRHRQNCTTSRLESPPS